MPTMAALLSALPWLCGAGLMARSGDWWAPVGVSNTASHWWRQLEAATRWHESAAPQEEPDPSPLVAVWDPAAAQKHESRSVVTIWSGQQGPTSTHCLETVTRTDHRHGDPKIQQDSAYHLQATYSHMQEEKHEIQLRSTDFLDETWEKIGCRVLQEANRKQKLSADSRGTSYSSRQENKHKAQKGGKDLLNKALENVGCPGLRQEKYKVQDDSDYDYDIAAALERIRYSDLKAQEARQQQQQQQQKLADKSRKHQESISCCEQAPSRGSPVLTAPPPGHKKDLDREHIERLVEAVRRGRAERSDLNAPDAVVGLWRGQGSTFLRISDDARRKYEGLERRRADTEEMRLLLYLVDALRSLTLLSIEVVRNAVLFCYVLACMVCRLGQEAYCAPRMVQLTIVLGIVLVGLSTFYLSRQEAGLQYLYGYQ